MNFLLKCLVVFFILTPTTLYAQKQEAVRGFVESFIMQGDLTNYELVKYYTCKYVDKKGWNGDEFYYEPEQFYKELRKIYGENIYTKLIKIEGDYEWKAYLEFVKNSVVVSKAELAVELKSEVTGGCAQYITSSDEKVISAHPPNAAQESWSSRNKNAYKIGEKVCTYKGNFFGYVEQSNENRLKVYVAGKVKDKADGYFYSGVEGSFYVEKVEGIRWYEKNEVSNCTFNAN